MLLFVCGLLNGTASSSDCIALDGGIIDELERTWKEVGIPKFEVLPWQLPGKTEE
jgi:hypothetical protein